MHIRESFERFEILFLTLREQIYVYLFFCGDPAKNLIEHFLKVFVVKPSHEKVRITIYLSNGNISSSYVHSNVKVIDIKWCQVAFAYRR